MRTERLLAPFLLLSLLSCAHEPDGHRAMGILADRPTRMPSLRSEVGVLNFNIVQRTCALYVAVRSNVWQEPIAFGRDIDESMVRWNVCPGGNMVACAAAPTANGDTIRTGIPWVHGEGPGN